MTVVGIVYEVLRLDEKMLLKELEQRARVEVVHAKSRFFPIEKPGNGYQFSVALNRCISFYTAVSVAAAFEASGVSVVNGSIPILLTGDKVLSTTIMLRNGIPVPRTALAFSQEEAVNAARQIGFPVVMKPIVGSWGRFLALARDEDTVRSIAEHREYMGGPYRVHYIQEYIDKPGRDIRAMCVGEHVPAAIYRVSSSWITNTARGGKAVPATIDAELEDIVVKACKALGVEVAGVDVVEDPNRGYLVLEVNGVPEFKNLTKATGVNVAAIIAEYVVEKARR